jgi:hypothetical protein
VLLLGLGVRRNAFRAGRLPRRLFCARTFTAALAVALLLVTRSQSQAADLAPKRVLMLHSFGLRFKPWTDYAEGVRSEISRKSNTIGIGHPPR